MQKEILYFIYPIVFYLCKDTTFVTLLELVQGGHKIEI